MEKRWDFCPHGPPCTLNDHLWQTYVNHTHHSVAERLPCPSPLLFYSFPKVATEKEKGELTFTVHGCSPQRIHWTPTRRSHCLHKKFSELGIIFPTSQMRKIMAQRARGISLRHITKKSFKEAKYCVQIWVKLRSDSCLSLSHYIMPLHRKLLPGVCVVVHFQLCQPYSLLHCVNLQWPNLKQVSPQVSHL